MIPPKKRRHPIKTALYYLGALLFMMSTLVNCAKRGTPTGGPQDSIAPAFVKATPPNYYTSFDKDQIRIFFDEYIKLTDYQKQLIISPPLKNSIISPQGSASKFIKISITDTLVPNTTYVFNFGQSIQDNNEGNPFSSFKYVMSTGTYIDSLTVSGSIIDELSPQADNFVSVMLYAVDSTLTDSIIYREPPRYVTNTLDSLTTFEISNIKEGQYMLIAMKDEDANYTFQPNKDKIAFLKDFITIPTDSNFVLKLFKEAPVLKASRPKQVAEGHITFGIQGPIDSITINLLTPKPDGFTSLWTRKPDQDSLHYWYKPALEIDSLIFEARGMEITDTLIMRLRNKTLDSLAIFNQSGRTLVLNKPLEIASSTPIATIEEDLITVLKDSTSIPFTVRKDSIYTQLYVDFKREENSAYEVQFLPGAITDFFEVVNDTLSYAIRTKEKSDYGGIALTLKNATNFPYIIQLLNNSGTVIESRWTDKETSFSFEFLEPGNYAVKAIEDANENRKYDTGNYLAKRQPENVINLPKPLDIQPSWYLVEDFDVSN